MHCTGATFVIKNSCLVPRIASFDTVKWWNSIFLKLDFFSFNSYVYYLTRGFFPSTRAFNPLTRAFSLPTCPFNLAAPPFSHLTHRFELVTRGFGLVPSGFELEIRKFELVTRVLLFLFYQIPLIKSRPTVFLCVCTVTWTETI